MIKLLRVLSTILTLTLVFVACTSVPESGMDPGFDRADFLVERIERAFENEEFGEALNLSGRGYERGLITADERRDYLDRLYEAELTAASVALDQNRFEDALRAEWNVHVLADYLGSIDNADVRLPTVASRDEILLRYSLAQLQMGEDVIALYLFLRRDAVGDLEQGTLVQFLELARRLNHDDAVRRIETALLRLEVDVPAPISEVGAVGDSPATMLSGTVTVWVNRGMRIENGVGLPDRVIGSGFFVDPRGYIMTNYHVISSEVDPEYEGYSRLFVKLPDRPDERIPARVIGYDRIFDLALLKIERDAEYVFSFSDTRRLEPGDPVLALGSPGGLDSTVTSGIVSAGGRRFLQIGEAMQVDAAINPGNSGGPLVLPDGQVAGVVFAGLEQFEGVNFAVPAYWVRHALPHLFEEGEIVHAWLGVSVHQVGQGLEVIYVAPDSPAERAGVEVGEILRSLNGRSVSTIAEAQDAIIAMDIGYWIPSVWERAQPELVVSSTPVSGETVDGVLPTLDVTTGQLETVERLIALDSRPYSPIEEALDRQSIEHLFPVLFGMDVDDISGAPWGPDYVITEVYPGTVADESSLSVDDPFALRDWRVDRNIRAAFIEIIIKKRKAGFLESGMQLGAYLETDSFL